MPACSGLDPALPVLCSRWHRRARHGVPWQYTRTDPLRQTRSADAACALHVASRRPAWVLGSMRAPRCRARLAPPCFLGSPLESDRLLPTATLTGHGARPGPPIEAATQWMGPPLVPASSSAAGSLRKAPSECAPGAPGAGGLRHRPWEAHMGKRGKGGQRHCVLLGFAYIHSRTSATTHLL